MEEITRKFTVQSKNGHILTLIEYSFPIDMAESSNRNDIVDIDRYTTEDGRTVEIVDEGYQILGENEIYYEHE